MKYALDSCSGFKWLVVEQDTDKARKLRDEYRQGVHELIAPDVFPVEVCHALTRAERQGRITPAEGVQLMADMLNTLPALFPSLPLLPRATRSRREPASASTTAFTSPWPSGRGATW